MEISASLSLPDNPPKGTRNLVNFEIAQNGPYHYAFRATESQFRLTPFVITLRADSPYLVRYFDKGNLVLW